MIERWAILTTAPDGTNSIYGPFTAESAAQTAQIVIDGYTDLDTQVIKMDKYLRSDFSIYS